MSKICIKCKQPREFINEKGICIICEAAEEHARKEIGNWKKSSTNPNLHKTTEIVSKIGSIKENDWMSRK